MDFPLNIMLAQCNPTVGDLEHNAEIILEAWKNAGDAELVVFPELVLCGYPPEDLILKPFFLEKVSTTLEGILENSKEFAAGALIGAPFQKDGKVYNAIHLIERGKIIATIAKHHLPDYGVFDETRVFAPAPLPAPVTFRNVNLGIMICEDMWFTDTAQNLKEKGADILIVPNASPFELDKSNIREEHASARVQETGLPLIYVNQIGGQDELVFDGGSFVMNADCKITMQMPLFENAIALAADTTISKQAPDEILYNALVTGLRDYVEKNGFPSVLIGMSGGIDSALAATLAVDALGPERVHTVMMPSPYTSEDSLQDALECAEHLGCGYETIPIEHAMTTYTNIIPGLEGVAHENMQSRTRGLILMALSNSSGSMVLSTGNKSEMAVGYATLYGDMCGGFNVLKDVYKTQVYALAKWRNTQGMAIPERIITKAPTAELKDNQTDQDTLPEYEQLDDILQCLIENDMGLEDIVKRGHTKETVSDVWRMLDRSEYKRRQAPPGVKVTSRAFGRDRRYPITNGFMNIVAKN